MFKNKTIRHGLINYAFPPKWPCRSQNTSIQSDKAPKHGKCVQLLITNNSSKWGFRLCFIKNLVSIFYCKTHVFFCRAVTRHEGQHDTTAIFLVSRPHRMANYGIWTFILNGGYIWFFSVCGAFIQIWTIDTIENGHNFWEKIRLGTSGRLYA
jgi:hypothetical protein